MDSASQFALSIGDQVKVCPRRNRIASSTPISIQFSSRLVVSKLIFPLWRLGARKARLSPGTRLGDVAEIEHGLSGAVIAEKNQLAWILIKYLSAQ